MKLREKIKDTVPVGYDAKEELSVFYIGTLISFLFGLGSFLLKLNNVISSLYWIKGSVKILKDGALMPHFTEILGKSLLPFAVLFLLCLSFILIHYEYHIRGSKSIYLMKRLPQNKELSKRIYTLPILNALSVLLAFLLTLGILFIIYYVRTPDGLVPLF